MTEKKERRFLEILFISTMVLLFLQTLTDFIESVYAYCLLTTGLNESVALVAVFFSPILLVLFRRSISPLFVVMLAELAIILRVAENSAPLEQKMLFSALGVGCFLLFFPSYLNNAVKSGTGFKGLATGLATAISVLLLVFLKSINASIDITTYSSISWSVWFFAAMAFILAPVVILSNPPDPQNQTARQSIFIKNPGQPSVFLAALGIVSVLTLIYFIFGSPAVMARWSGDAYNRILAVQLTVTFLYCLYTLVSARSEFSMSIPRLFGWNLTFVILLTVYIYRLQVSFPDSPESYPVFAGDPDFATIILQYLVIILHPILFINLSVFTQRLTKAEGSIARFGFGFFTAAFLMLVIIFSHIFTTVYDYIPVVGPFFRDKFWLVHLVVGLGMLFPTFWLRSKNIKDRNFSFTNRDKFLLTCLCVGLPIITLVGLSLNQTSPPLHHIGKTLKIMTFNIQQGYDANGVKRYDEQIDLIKSLDPDIIGLQESDSIRIAGGNTDLVRYYSEKLNMHAYHGPSPVTGTFGIALLSKYPIKDAKTFFMFSEGEQTATIKAKIGNEENGYTILVTHLGNDGDMVQQKAILSTIENEGKTILMGDFNFTPDTPQYKLTTKSLLDSWKERWPNNVEANGFSPDEANYGRIDHIFVTRDFSVSNSYFIPDSFSDHPALITELSL